MSSYKDAGVDINAGNEAVRRIVDMVTSTQRHFPGRVLGGIGGFSGLVQYKKDRAILGAATDGVGSKLLIAQLLEQYDGIGNDLVGMCINDLVASGFTPSFFLDYIAMAEQVPERTEKIVASIADACDFAETALIGGEMAELPGLYAPGHFDLAGFAVGRVHSEKDLLQPSKIVYWMGRLRRSGKKLHVYGAASNGVHANGFSLIRKVFGIDSANPEAARKILNTYYEELGLTLGEALLRPTYIYHRRAKKFRDLYNIVGLVHITGGGLVDNPPRIMPKGYAIRIDLDSWEVDPLFHLISKKGNIGLAEMFRVFNCGIGMLFISPDDLAGKGLDLVGEVVRCEDVNHTSSATIFTGGQGLFPL